MYQIKNHKKIKARLNYENNFNETSKRVWPSGEVISFKIKSSNLGNIGQIRCGLTRLGKKGKGIKKLNYMDRFAIFKTGQAQF